VVEESKTDDDEELMNEARQRLNQSSIKESHYRT
jgi:hypothetical protein